MARTADVLRAEHRLRCSNALVAIQSSPASNRYELAAAGYTIPQLLGKVLLLPGGVGAVEASMVALYASLGVRHEVGVIVILAYRVISFWIPTLLGLIAACYLEHTTRQKKLLSA
jgi:uncharacterized protein (TIRG00374 family)